MDVVLAGTDSLKLTRLARGNPSLRMIPCGDRDSFPRPGPLSIDALRPLLPNELLGFTVAKPISLGFFSREARSQSSLVDSRVYLAELPRDSFFEVVREDGASLGPGSGAARLFVESPGLSLVGLARRFLGLVKRGLLSEDAAFARMLSFSMEACGLYARDPLSPLVGECAYDIEQLTSADELRSYLGELTHLQGLHLALEAARYAQDGSGSPGETLLSLVMRLPPRRGGIPLPSFVENRPIEWPDDARDIVRHQMMRPDFHWIGHHTAAEYNGGVHGTLAAHVEDSYRVQDYAACNITMIPATYDDIKNVTALERFVKLVSRKLAPYEDPGFLRRVSDNAADKRAREKRVVLLGQLLPPDVRRDE